MSNVVERLREAALPARTTERVLCDEAADEIERLRAKEARLREALQHAVEELEFWGAYASDYFKEKHGFDETIEKLSTALAEKEKK
jgi:hypothetical protein